MALFLIAVVSLLASLLTFFSGFGLGTLLMPVFAIFFPIDIAIALTGLVHLANNLFKLLLTGKHIHWQTAIRFGLPAMLAAIAGAWFLTKVHQWPLLAIWHWGENTFEILPVKVIIACLLLVFVFLEMSPRFEKFQFGKEMLPVGGILSGFFGGLSGHQGALRSAFLVKAGLSKEAFIATGIIIACGIDVARLGMYSQRFMLLEWKAYGLLLTIATLSAFAGAFAGSRLLKKVTMKQVQGIVGVALVLLSVCLGIGLI
jgi:uncharacterized protein